MKKLLKKSLLTTASILIATTAAQQASAQTASVTATAEVLNSLTLATASQLNFGTVVAVGGNGGGNNARVIVDVAGAVTVATDGAPAVTAVVDDAAATAAQITVADGANGATLNLVINNITNPTNGTDTFDLLNTAYSTSYNGAAAATRTGGTPWTETFDSTFGGGTNTLDIGATLQTQAAEAAYSDGTYTGGFDVVFSY